MSSRWACSCRLAKAVAFFLQLAVFGPCNGGSFARATKSPPIVAPEHRYRLPASPGDDDAHRARPGDRRRHGWPGPPDRVALLPEQVATQPSPRPARRGGRLPRPRRGLGPGRPLRVLSRRRVLSRQRRAVEVPACEQPPLVLYMSRSQPGAWRLPVPNARSVETGVSDSVNGVHHERSEPRDPRGRSCQSRNALLRALLRPGRAGPAAVPLPRGGAEARRQVPMPDRRCRAGAGPGSRRGTARPGAGRSRLRSPRPRSRRGSSSCLRR